MIDGWATKDKSVTDHRLCDSRGTEGDHEVVQAANSLKTCDVSPPLALRHHRTAYYFDPIDDVIVTTFCFPVIYLFMHSFIKYRNKH